LTGGGWSPPSYIYIYIFIYIQLTGAGWAREWSREWRREWVGVVERGGRARVGQQGVVAVVLLAVVLLASVYWRIVPFRRAGKGKGKGTGWVVGVGL
jgi:hypothetical protein